MGAGTLFCTSRGEGEADRSAGGGEVGARSDDEGREGESEATIASEEDGDDLFGFFNKK